MLQNALYFYSLLVPSKQNTTFSLFSDVFLRCQNLDIMNGNVLIVCARIFFFFRKHIFNSQRNLSLISVKELFIK